MCVAHWQAGRQRESESVWVATLLWEHLTGPHPSDCLPSACGGWRCFCHTVKVLHVFKARCGSSTAVAAAAVAAAWV